MGKKNHSANKKKTSPNKNLVKSSFDIDESSRSNSQQLKDESDDFNENAFKTEMLTGFSPSIRRETIKVIENSDDEIENPSGIKADPINPRPSQAISEEQDHMLKGNATTSKESNAKHHNFTKDEYIAFIAQQIEGKEDAIPRNEEVKKIIEESKAIYLEMQAMKDQIKILEIERAKLKAEQLHNNNNNNINSLPMNNPNSSNKSVSSASKVRNSLSRNISDTSVCNLRNTVSRYNSNCKTCAKSEHAYGSDTSIGSDYSSGFYNCERKSFNHEPRVEYRAKNKHRAAGEIASEVFVDHGRSLKKEQKSVYRVKDPHRADEIIVAESFDPSEEKDPIPNGKGEKEIVQKVNQTVGISFTDGSKTQQLSTVAFGDPADNGASRQGAVGLQMIGGDDGNASSEQHAQTDHRCSDQDRDLMNMGFDPKSREDLRNDLFVGPTSNSQRCVSEQQGAVLTAATSPRLTAVERSGACQIPVRRGTFEKEEARGGGWGPPFEKEGIRAGNGSDVGQANLKEKEKEVENKAEENKGLFGNANSWASILKPLKSKVQDRITVSFQAPNANQKRGQVSPPEDIAEAGSREFEFTLVGYILDTNLPYSLVHNTAVRYWSRAGLKDILATDSGFYFFKFDCIEQCKAALEGGPWHIVGHPLILRQWHKGLKLSKEAIKVIPMWVKIYDIPLEYWNSDGLSCIGSSIGKPLQVDQVTSMRRRISYARMCIEIEAEDPLLDKLELKVKNPINKQLETIDLKLEYQRKPRRCDKCKVFGHDCDEKVKEQQQKEERVVHNPQKSIGRTGEWQVKGNRKNVIHDNPNPPNVIQEINQVSNHQIPNVLGSIKIDNKFSALEDCEEGSMKRRMF